MTTNCFDETKCEIKWVDGKPCYKRNYAPGEEVVICGPCVIRVKELVIADLTPPSFFKPNQVMNFSKEESPFT